LKSLLSKFMIVKKNSKAKYSSLPEKKIK